MRKHTVEITCDRCKEPVKLSGAINDPCKTVSYSYRSENSIKPLKKQFDLCDECHRHVVCVLRRAVQDMTTNQGDQE